MNNWIELSHQEKNEFVNILNNRTNSTPTVFNLRSDRDDTNSKFREMSRKDVIKAAEDSVKWITSGIY